MLLTVTALVHYLTKLMVSCNVSGHDNVWSVRFLLILHRDIFLLV